MDSLSLEEKNNLKEILVLLKEYNKEDNKNEEVVKKIDEKLIDFKNGISFLIKSIFYEIFEIPEFSLEDIINIMQYLKNIINKNISKLNSLNIISYSKQIIQLIFNENKFNQNLNNQQILDGLTSILHLLLITSKKYFNHDIEDLFKIILDNISLKNNEEFILILKYLINFSSILISLLLKKHNYEEIFNNYFDPINKKIFDFISNYTNQMPLDFNNDIICAIKMLFNSFYKILNDIKNSKMQDNKKEIGKIFFEKYGKYIYHFIQLNPMLDEESKKIYEKENPIIPFNIDEKKYNELNAMKSNIFAFLTILINIMKEKNKEGEKCIKEKDLIKLSNKIFELIISSFKDILKNKEKFNFLMNYSGGDKIEEDGLNLLLNKIFYFFKKYLNVEPFKKRLSSFINTLILDILFPMMINNIEEKNLLNYPNIKVLTNHINRYDEYLFSSTKKCFNKHFIYSIFGLIDKLCRENYERMGFILSFCIEMMNDIINAGKIENYLGNYNIYFKYISNSYINRFNNVQKLDLSLSIIIILEPKIKNSYFKYYFREILVNNQKKFHLIANPVIQLKLLIIYKFYLCELFERIPCDTEEDNLDEQSIPINLINIFNENAVNYLINNIIQDKNNYKQNLCKQACNTLIRIINIYEKDNNTKDDLVKYTFESLSKNFSSFISLFEIIDEKSFYSLIEKILSLIKINEKNLLFDCLKNLINKILKEDSKNKEKEYDFSIKYYFSTIINTFLKGEDETKEKNIINYLEKNDFIKFDEIFSPILANFDKYDFKNEIIVIARYYIEYLDEIKDINVLLLKKIGEMIEKEKYINPIFFNYMVKFMAKMKKKSLYFIGEEDLISEITILIKKSFSCINIQNSDDDSIEYLYILLIHLILIKENLDEDFLKFIINKCLEKEEYFFEKNNRVIQIKFAIICLCIIFYPEITFEALKLNSTDKSFIFAFKNLLNDYSYINFPKYSSLLNKCIILGFCSIFTNITWLTFLNNDKEMKLFFFYKLMEFINKQKLVLNKTLNILTKKEIYCNFIDECDNNDEDLDIDLNDQFELNEKISFALKNNDKIISYDEFKLFSQVYNYIKKNDKELFDKLFISKFSTNLEYFENILLYTIIKVEYKEKEYFQARKIIKLKNIGNK